MYGLQSLSFSILPPPRRRKARQRRRDWSAADFFPGKWRKRNTRGSGTLLSLSLLQCGGGRQKKNPYSLSRRLAPPPAAREGGGEGRINPAECFFSLQERGGVPPSRLQPHFVTFYTNSIFRSFFMNAGFLVLGGNFRSEASLHPSLQSFFSINNQV